jgi:hypothetical protein
MKVVACSGSSIGVFLFALLSDTFVLTPTAINPILRTYYDQGYIKCDTAIYVPYFPLLL